MRPIPILLAVMFAAACAPKDRSVRLARLDGERRSLAASLDHLEDRLLTDQARVRFWRDMKSRHESVSAIACAVQTEHAEAMATRALPERSVLHRAKVAAATPVQKARVRTDAR